ncbi:MAG: tetronasin resistance protein [Erysipelotrichales bacterium]
MKEKFMSWPILLRNYLKRDWKKILFWIIGLVLFAGGFIPAFEELSKGQGLIGMYETMQNPAMISMVGPTPIHNANEYTIGAMYTNEMLLFSGLFAMVISILHIVSHTRKEEDLGLSEIIRSFKVGRHANSLALMIEVILINIIIGILIALLMVSFNVPTINFEGSLLFGFSIAGAGILGAAIALVIAQLVSNSSAANGLSLSVVGILYILRASSDISNVNLSMLNPMGWIYLTYPFVKNNWLPIIYIIIFSFIFILIGFILESKRDMGSGYFPEFQGRANAKKSLLSIRGYLLRINRGTIIAWLVTFTLLGVAYGSIYGDMQTFINSNDMLKEMFSQTGYSIEESFSATIMMVIVVLIAILPIVIINKLFVEESRGRLTTIMSTKVSRFNLFWTTIIIASIIGAIAILLSAGGLGLTAISVMKDSDMNLIDFIKAYPSILFFIALASLFLGWLPRHAKVVYIYLGYSFVLNYFGDLVNIPNWLMNTAVHSWIPHIPVKEFNLIIFLCITIISILMIVIGYLGYKKRDMIESN